MRRSAAALAVSIVWGCGPGPPIPLVPRDSTPTEDTGRLPGLPSNVLVILIDDLGVDGLALYSEHPDAPATPRIEALAATGVLFRNAYATPTCSPARAALLTGRHGRRTGVGASYSPYGEDFGLPLEEITIPEMLTGAADPWSTAAIGKWHLATEATGGVDNPNLQGFDTFRGTAGNLLSGHSPLGAPQDYFSWEKIVDGTTTRTEGYALTDSIDDAIDLASSLPEPWFLYVALHSVHVPFHVPPDPLNVPGIDESAGEVAQFRAMTQAVDLEVDRLLSSMEGSTLDETMILLLGDNGTPSRVTTDPFDTDRAKKTIFEGGVGIPMILSGPMVASPGREVDALVHIVDLFPTIAELAGVPLDAPEQPTLDGHSLLPFLVDPTNADPREFLYVEQWSPNQAEPTDLNVDDRAIRDERWKLVRRRFLPDALFDLSTVPVEGLNLLRDPLNAEATAAYDRLDAALIAQAEAFSDD